VLASDRVDLAVVAVSALVGETARAIAADIVELSATTDKPIVVGWMLPESTVAEAFALLREHRIPVFDSVTLACSAADALAPSRVPVPCTSPEPAQWMT
jgi:acyl-CoA synthetase (NDP forming)